MGFVFAAFSSECLTHDCPVMIRRFVFCFVGLGNALARGVRFQLLGIATILL